MSRKVVDCMDQIFEILKEKVSQDDYCRITETKRHIKAEGDETIVVDFVKKASIKKEPFGDFPACIFFFDSKKYLLVKDMHAKTVRDIGYSELVTANVSGEGTREAEEDIRGSAKEIIQGCEMLAIVERVIDVLPEYKSIDIIDKCLGWGDGEKDTVFSFAEIRAFFENNVVFEIDDNRFPLLYTEDFYRLLCYCMCDKKHDYFDKNTLEVIKQLLLLDSSRSVAASITNAINSSIEEYAFLQFYQCLEYLFRLNNSFMIKASYNMSVNDSIDLVTAYEFKITECENLRRVLFENTSEDEIDRFLSKVAEDSDGENQEEKTREKKTDIIAQYIYKIRCKVAHLRYEPNPFQESIDWTRLMSAIVELVFSIYQRRDNDIVESCNTKKVWDELTE